MKLYLASKHVQFPDELVKHVGSSNDKPALVRLVVNGFDNYPEERRQMHVGQLEESLSKTGFDIQRLDLRDYVENNQGLVTELQDCDLLWISGGNVFYLRYLLKQCGLDKNLGGLLQSGLVYGGDSAGSAVLGSDMHGLELLDDPSEAREVIFDGLGITPFIILPHWGNERYADEITGVKTILEKNNVEVITISDDQVCVIDGASRRIIG